MIRHPRRSTPAAFVAATLLAICVVVIVSVIQFLLDRPPLLAIGRLLTVTSSLRWSSAGTISIGVVLAVLGLVLLVVAVRPGKPTVLPLTRRRNPEGQAGADAGVRRHTLAKDLATAAATVAGVTTADVTARRTTITARVRVAATDPNTVPGQVSELLDARIAAIGPATRPRVRVRARTDKNT